MNVAQLLARAAQVFPDNPALFRGAELVCDYRELARRAAAMARQLREIYGLQAGDRVALFMSNCPAYLETLYAIWYAGLVAVPINCKLHPREAEYILDHSGARCCFTSPDLAAALDPLRANLISLEHLFVADSSDYLALREGVVAPPVAAAGDDLAWLFYTSGTTGRPKGVMLSHRNLLTMTLCYLSDVDAVAPEDCTIYAAPMSHGAGMYSFVHMLKAARHVVPASGGFDPAEIFALTTTHSGAALFAAPTMVRRMIDYAREHQPLLDGLKTIVYGGGPMYIEDIKEGLAILGDRFVQIYGQGESPMTITALSRRHLQDREHPRYLERIASVGVAQSAVEVRVADRAGHSLPPGETGEVLVRGDTVMRGYWQNPEASAAALREGWLYTGDVGSLDADGFLTLKDRSKDVIISGGSNIYPREVEEVLLQHPDVQEVSVVGRAHAEWGEIVVAFVVARPGAALDLAELDALCLEHIARFKRPKEYRLVAELPKNNYGKVLKTELRKSFE